MNHIKIGLFFLLTHFSIIAQITVDGKTTDWSENGTLSNYDKVAHLEYEVKHSDSNLYICVRISDTKFQLKAITSGLTIYLDTNGKKKQQLGINFPIKNTKSSPMKMGEMGKQPDSLMIRQKMEEALKETTVKGFLSHNGTFPTDQLIGMEIAGKFDEQQHLVLEYRIPFQSVYGHSNLAELKKNLSVIIYIDKMEMPSFGEGGGPGDGPMGGPPPFASGGPGGEMPDFSEIEQFLQSSTTIMKYSFLK